MNKGVKIDVTRAKTDTIFEGVEKAGLVAVGNDEKAPFVWIEGILHRDSAMKYDPGQLILKIPAMDVMCYKSTLFQALNHVRHFYPQQMSVYPPTFLLPSEFLEFQRQHMNICWKERCAPTWVMKPKNDCCGRGISLVQSVNEVQDLKEEYVIQQYVKPYLINGRKFDFRIYVFIASLSPLVIFIYKEGIARFCTAQFSMPSKTNKYQKFIHLTNTAINVENSDVDPSNFTKRVSEVLDQIDRKHHCKRELWNRIINATRTVIIGILPKIYSLLPTAKTFERKKNATLSKSMIGKEDMPEECEDENEALGESLDKVVDAKDESEESEVEKAEDFGEIPPIIKVSVNQSLVKPLPSLHEPTNPQVHSKSSLVPPVEVSKLPDIKPKTEGTTEEKEEETVLKPRPIKSRYAHILGIDIILDSNLNPQVLELNDRPSLHVTVDFERELKVGLISESFEHILSTGEIFSDSPKSQWQQIFPMKETEPAYGVLHEIYSKAKKANSFGEITPPTNEHAFAPPAPPKKKKEKKSKKIKKPQK